MTLESNGHTQENEKKKQKKKTINNLTEVFEFFWSD